MSGSTTTYAIEVLYRTKDQASQGLDSIGRGAERASRSTGGLLSALKGVGTALVGYGALRLGKSAFIDFNSSIEASTISLAAQEKMLLGGRWDTAMSHANQLFVDYQQVAKQSVGETKDFLEMHAGIASSAYRAGLGMKELKEMTIGATVASAALGERADMVALDVKQMLSGDVTSRDRTAQILLASQNTTQEAFNKMNQKRRNAIVTAALNDPALKAAAKAMGESFSGVTSTLKDNLQIAAGKIGLPLFKAITAEVAKWNDWIEKNPDKIRQFAADFTSALMTGFGYIKQIAGFIVENKDLLMTLAKAWLAGKVIGGIAGGVSGAVKWAGRAADLLDGGKGMKKWLGVLGGTGAGSLGSLAGRIAAVAGPIGAAAGVVATGVAVGVGLNEREKDLEWRRAEAKGFWGTAHRGMDTYGQAQAGQFSGRDAAYRLRLTPFAGQEKATKMATDMVYRRLIDEARGNGFMKSDGGMDKDAIWKVGGMAGVGVQEIQSYVAMLDRVLTHQAWVLAAKGLSLVSDELKQIGDIAPAVFGVALQHPFATFTKALKKINNVDDAAKGKQGDGKPNIEVKIVMTEDPDRFSIALNGATVDALKNPRGAASVWPEHA
jgi:hypothetical protein